MLLVICAKGRLGLVCTGTPRFQWLGAQKTFRYSKMLLINSVTAQSRSAPIPFWH